MLAMVVRLLKSGNYIEPKAFEANPASLSSQYFKKVFKIKRLQQR